MRLLANRVAVLMLLVLPLVSAAQDLKLPNKSDSVRFAVIGDNGTGDRSEYDVGRKLVEYRAKFPFTFVVMNGDNMYGGESPVDFERKFAQPYKDLLAAGVKFYASLGNHDDPNERFYKNYNMDGKRYYTFSPKKDIRFFALDSNYMDRQQLDWVEKELRNSKDAWKICFFHHPLYSSGGTHGSAVALREILEPLLIRYGVSVVFAGHEHFYERIKPQKGIQYFISGAAGQLRRGDIHESELKAKGFDQDNHFMLIEITGDQMYFQAISRTGQTVDSGVVERRKEQPENGKKVTELKPPSNP
jgi:predicted MPP superfamily phosphohydrolase